LIVPATGQRVVRRALGRRLARLRLATGRTRREVAEAQLGISEPTLHRIETGKTPVTAANVRALCWLYGVDQAITDALAEMAVGTSQQEWWDASPVIPEWFKLYLGLEASAIRICGYHGEMVPAELQTADYARALFAVEQTSEEIDRLVGLRLQRQQALLERRPAPQLTVVLGQGALTRPVGGPRVLAGQLAHLRNLDRKAQVEILVLPWSVGGHAAMAGAFRILDFDDPEDPDVVYVQPHIGAWYMEQPAEVAEYRRVFQLINKVSVSIQEWE
jgi:transcriptional regulator with XRE-family HTH domain